MFHKTGFSLVCAVFLITGVQAEEFLIHSYEKKILNREFWAEGADAGDFNNDGVMDVVSGPYWYAGPDFRNRVAFYPDTETSVIQWSDTSSEVIRGFAGGLGNRNAYSDNFLSFAEDCNGDSWDDIIVIPFPGKETYWYENPQGKSNGFWKKHLILSVTDNESPQLVDVDGDSKRDLVCNSEGYFGYATRDVNNPQKPWKWVRISEKGPWQRFTHGLGIGDVDGDGRKDILGSNAWWSQPENPESGPWKRHNFNFAPGGSSHMFAYDVDGDGDNDVITCLAAHGYGLCWYEHVKVDGKISFKEHIFMNKEIHENKYGVKFTQPHAMAMADMDGDGILDLITGKRFWAHGPNGDPEPGAPAVVYWFKIKRDGDSVDFVPYKMDDDSGVGTQVEVKDMDGNGFPDVIIGNKKGVFVLLHKAEKVDKATWKAAQPKPLD